MTARAARRQPVPGRGESTAQLEFGLLSAAYNGDAAAAIAALEEGADVGARHAETGLTALHIAVGTNNLPLARLLIEDWESPFVPDGYGRMPSIVAAECCVSEELCDYIVEKEAGAAGEEPGG